MTNPGRAVSSGTARIGVNLRVTAHASQGGRRYMEDMLCVAYQPTADEKDLLYAYIGMFDGHGGREAAVYTKDHLMDNIVGQKQFWDEDDVAVRKSIREGFLKTHHDMLRELNRWPKTPSGLPSTSGTTATIAFVRRSKLYIGHVGDSGLILGYEDPENGYWRGESLTVEHKPDNPAELARISQVGGKVIRKSGVPRVVWNRPRLGHQGPVRRSTLMEEIPFLAVARSLGDFWSYNSDHDEFVVSPDPDVMVVDIDISTCRCLIFASDGLLNMINAQEAVNSVFFAEKNNERQLLASPPDTVPTQVKNWINPSKRLVDRALDMWYNRNLRADNTSVVTVVIDPPGPPKSQVFRATYNVASKRPASPQNDLALELSGITTDAQDKARPVLVHDPTPHTSGTSESKIDSQGQSPSPQNNNEESLPPISSEEPAKVQNESHTPVPSLLKSSSSTSLISELTSPPPVPSAQTMTERQVLQTRRATSSNLPFPLNPPIIATPCRATTPRRPVITHRRHGPDVVVIRNTAEGQTGALNPAVSQPPSSETVSDNLMVVIPMVETEESRERSKRRLTQIVDPHQSLDETLPPMTKRSRRSDDPHVKVTSQSQMELKTDEPKTEVASLQIHEVTSTNDKKKNQKTESERNHGEMSILYRAVTKGRSMIELRNEREAIVGQCQRITRQSALPPSAQAQPLVSVTHASSTHEAKTDKKVGITKGDKMSNSVNIEKSFEKPVAQGRSSNSRKRKGIVFVPRKAKRSLRSNKKPSIHVRVTRSMVNRLN